MTALEYAEGLLSPVTEEHKAEARIIISELTALPIGRINIEAPPLSEALKESIDGIAKRRARGEPLQYILGKWEFMGMPFYTRPCALIPRQDTETLCEEALSIGGKTLLDLCCGTGCIGVSLAKLGGFEVTFGDISPDCLALARENAALNGVSGKFLLTDMFSDISDSFDLICVNPPYIPTSELASLQAEVKREPGACAGRRGGRAGLLPPDIPGLCCPPEPRRHSPYGGGRGAGGGRGGDVPESGDNKGYLRNRKGGGRQGMKRLLPIALSMMLLTGCAVGAALPAEPEITPSPTPTFSPRRSRRCIGPAWA